MTAPTKAELREAVEQTLADMAAYDCFDCPIKDRAEIWIMNIRAFLDSGLTDDERETVRKVRGSMAIALAHFEKTWRTDPNVVAATDGEVCGWIAALAPIAEGK